MWTAAIGGHRAADECSCFGGDSLHFTLACWRRKPVAFDTDYVMNMHGGVDKLGYFTPKHLTSNMITRGKQLVVGATTVTIFGQQQTWVVSQEILVSAAILTPGTWSEEDLWQSCGFIKQDAAPAWLAHGHMFLELPRIDVPIINDWTVGSLLKHTVNSWIVSWSSQSWISLDCFVYRLFPQISLAFPPSRGCPSDFRAKLFVCAASCTMAANQQETRL